MLLEHNILQIESSKVANIANLSEGWQPWQPCELERGDTQPGFQGRNRLKSGFPANPSRLAEPLHQNRLPKFPAQNCELAGVHHLMIGQHEEQTADRRTELLQGAGVLLVQIGLGERVELGNGLFADLLENGEVF